VEGLAAAAEPAVRNAASSVTLAEMKTLRIPTSGDSWTWLIINPSAVRPQSITPSLPSHTDDASW
jgi:hypothetical protein